MNRSSTLKLKKHHLALLLASVALLSYAATVIREQVMVQNPGILTAVAATDAGSYKMFLKLDTIPGEAGDSQHKGEIEIDSFAWSATRATGATRPSLDGLKVTMPANKASAKIFLYTAGGLKISRAVLSVRKNGSSDDFLKWILTDTYIVSYQTVGNTHGDGVTDQITLSAGKVEMEYKPADGSALVKTGWDQRTGKSVSY